MIAVFHWVMCWVILDTYTSFRYHPQISTCLLTYVPTRKSDFESYSPITALCSKPTLLCGRPHWGLISKMRISTAIAAATTDIPILPKSANTFAYTRSSSTTNMSHIGSDQRPSTDESYEDMMYKIHRYAAITAQLRHWAQLSYQIDTMHHPELVSDTIRITAPDTIHIANIGAGGLWSDWTENEV